MPLLTISLPPPLVTKCDDIVPAVRVCTHKSDPEYQRMFESGSTWTFRGTSGDDYSLNGDRLLDVVKKATANDLDLQRRSKP